MSSELITIGVIGSVTILAAGAIHHNFKQSQYEMWKHDFEKELGFSPMEEEVIRDLYDTSTSPKEAALIYKELKEAELEIIWKGVEAQRTELLTIEECIERYSLTEDEIAALKKKMDEKSN